MNWQTDLDKLSTAQRQMVETQLRLRGLQDEPVLTAMARVPRHEFVDRGYWPQAYEDHPIPIGEGQTVSQPYIVAVSLRALDLLPSDTVLEVGTGSGYQTALLASVVERVYSVERHAPLAETARAILTRLGYENVEIEIGDGSIGLPGSAPYDAIVVSAAAPRIPKALLDQLREGGRMVIPVGSPDAQELMLVRKLDGTPIITTLERCRFVPLIGAQGYPAK
jgi:protein-L-isoaspartate(D-aspartate) O-methyltransferase